MMSRITARSQSHKYSCISQKYKETAKAPLLINSCTIDQPFPPSAQKIADEILGDGQFVPGYKRTYWEGCTHGFAVRGDLVSLSYHIGVVVLTRRLFANRATQRSKQGKKVSSEKALHG